MACIYTYKGKQYSESEIKDIVFKKEVNPADIKFATLNDLANLLAYTNSKIILPGSKVEYTTPDNQKFSTYQEASNHVSKLFNESKDVDLSDVGLNVDKNNNPYNLVPDKPYYTSDSNFLVFVSSDKIQHYRDFSEYKDLEKQNYYEYKFITSKYNYEFVKVTIERVQQLVDNNPGLYIGASKELQNADLSKIGIKNFIEKNKQFEQSKEIIETWKKENNIVYNPEEVYSRGQGFYSAIGAYSTVELDLLLQNLLQHIEDNKKAGGSFDISAFTAPVGKTLKHLGGESQVRFVIYPKSEDIKWAAPTDVYSGSVWDASEKVSKDKKSELLGVSHTKAPSLQNINEISPNLASIIDERSHHHNELGIELTPTNFRLEFDDTVPYEIKQLVNSVNSILDSKYGKIVKPEIKEGKIDKYVVKDTQYFEGEEFVDLKEFNTKEEAEKYIDSKKLYGGNRLKIEKQQGIQPQQTKENTTSIESVKNKTVNKFNVPNDINKEIETLESIAAFGYIGNQEEQLQYLKDVRDGKIEPKEKEYTSQALINTKIAKLKEVAKKYPRSLITSKVVNNQTLERQYQLNKLTFISNEEKYNEDKDAWRFSKLFTIPQQLNIDNTLTGVTFQFISKAILEGKGVNLFSTEVVNEQPQIITKKIYTKKLEELNKKSELGLQETELKTKLEELLKPEVWNKFQESVLNNIKRFGFEINKTGNISELEFDSDDVLGISTTEENNTDEDVTSDDNATGKAKNFSDYAEYTISTKEKLSPRLKVWLSTIPANEESYIGLSFPKLNIQNTYLPIDVVINAINESTVGKRTPEGIINSLEKTASEIENRYFLAEVARRLKLEQTQDSRIPNEFFSKFNQTKNEMVMVKTTASVRKVNNEIVKDENNNPVFDLQNEVININRNEIPSNLRENWFQVFSFENSEEVDNELVISKQTYNNIYKKYLSIKDSLFKHFNSYGELINENDRIEVRQKLNELFSIIGVDLNVNTLDALIDSKINKYSKFKVESESIFNEKSGILGQIFSEFKPDNSNAAKGFGSTGMLRLSFEESKYVDSFMNTSAKDGKNRSIWAYGLNNPFTREMWDIILSAKELLNQKEQMLEGADVALNEYILELKKTHYSSNSEILNYLTTLTGESFETFVNNLKWQIYNVTKSSVKGAKGKELKHMNEREFINSQIQLFTNNTLSSRVGGVMRKWSYKFLTTPSDKTTMFILRTPDHKIELSQDLQSVKPVVVDLFFEKFKAEYTKIKAYLEGSPEYQKAIDSIETYEPKVFYSFAQFNVKSKFLWTDNLKLRDLTDVVDGISTTTYIKDKIKLQIEQDIVQTKKDWEKYGFIENGKLITGFDAGYVASLPKSVTNAGILETIETSLPTRPELKEQYLRIKNEADRKITDYLVADFSINKHYFNIESSQLVLGDPTMFLKNNKQKITQEQFKNSNLEFYKKWVNSVRDNLSKRMAGLQGSGTEGVWETETANTIVISDPKTSSKIIDEIKKLSPENSEKFSEIDVLDGQEFVTAQEDLALKLAMGKITKTRYNELLDKVNKASEDIEKQGFVSEENLFTANERAIAQAHKPLVWALITDPFTKLRKVTYNKPSAFGLYPQFTQGLEIDKLRQSVHNNNKTNKRVDRIVMLSAAKLGAKSPIKDVFNTDGSLNSFEISLQSIDEIPRKYFRIQLEVPYKKAEEVRMLTQAVKLMFNEVQDVKFDASSLDLDLKEISGKDLKQYHDETYSETFKLNYDNFLIQTGAKKVNGSYVYEDYQKLQESLYEHAVTQEYDLNELEGLQLTEDKLSFKLPLAFSAKADRYEKLLLSLINNIILQKIHGRSFILASEAGFKPTKKTEIKEGREANDWINYNKTNIVFTENFNPTLGLLPQRPDPKNLNKTLPAQVLVSFKFFDNKKKELNLNNFLYEKDGHKFLDTSKISPELLKLIGLRVPNQSHASMADIEIVGFIPDFMGDLIIAPQDFTKQMGSDFDIDKLYSYMYNYMFNERTGKLSRLIFNEGKVRESRNKKVGGEEEKNLFIAIFGDEAKQAFQEDGDKFEKFINKQKIKLLHNTLQDIYHVVLSNTEVYKRMLEGITEGNLQELANNSKEINPQEDTEMPSPFSDRYKTIEYFDNAAGKLGIGIYSANSTFLSLVEGKNLFLQKQQRVPYTNKNGESKTKLATLPNPFKIKNSKEETIELVELSANKGVNRLISMFQSASVDNAKLKILSLLNIDKNTMGITSVMAALANDSIKENGKPVYSEDYIIKFISQPSVLEYLEGLKKGSDDVKRNPNKSWKSDLYSTTRNKYTQELLDLLGEEEGYKFISKPNEGYSQKDLDFGILEKTLNTGQDRTKWLKLQLDVLEQFEYFEKVAKLLRGVQNLTNSDAKGVPQTIQEALFKKQSLITLLENASKDKTALVLGNISNVFEGLSNEFIEYGVNLPIEIYKGGRTNSPILPYATIKYDKFVKEFKIIQNSNQEDVFFNALESANLQNAFLSNVWADPSLNIIEKSISEERLDLLKDTENNKSLATDIEEFKNTELFFNNGVLKPLFNSLKLKQNKKDPSLKFVDFSISVGLINPDTEIIQSLEYLRQINYPLFEKLIKYSLIVVPADSNTSLKKFIPNFFLNAIGISENLRKINDLLNTHVQEQQVLTPYTAERIPFSQFVLQIFQHYPNFAQNIENSSNFFEENKSKIVIPQIQENSQYNVNYDGGTYASSILSTYDSEKRKWRLYLNTELEYNKETNERKAIYTEIPTLGDYNLSEFDPSTTSILPISSIIQKNNPDNYKIKVKENKSLPNLIVEQTIKNPNAINLGHLQANYKVKDSNTAKENVVGILETIKLNSTNKSYKALSDILLQIAKKQNNLDSLNLMFANKNEYDLQTQTITLDTSELDSNKFIDSFQYNFLHELVHHLTISKMLDGSDISKLLIRNVQNLINTLETKENLQKGINLLKLKTTPEQLLTKLQSLRSEQNTSDSLTTFSSEEERSILNPLINPFEFVSSILNDENSQKWMNSISTPQSELSIFGKFVDYIKGLFNNLIRTLNLSVSNKSVLNEGLTNTLQILVKDVKEQDSQLNLFASLKNIVKLTPTEPIVDGNIEIKKEAILRQEQRKNLLWNQYNKIQLNTSLKQEEKQPQIEAVLKRISTVDITIDKLKNDFSAAVLEEELLNALFTAKEILKKPSPTIEEIMDVVSLTTSIKFMVELAVKYKNTITPELEQSLSNIYGKSSDIATSLVSLSKDYVVSDYKDSTGRTITEEEFFNQNEENKGKTGVLGGEDNNNPMPQYAASLSYNMGIDIEQEIIDRQIKNKLLITPFSEKYDFRNLLQERKEKDSLTKVTNSIKNFKTRSTSKYYEAFTNLFNSASQITDGKNKASFIKSELNKMQFVLDLRYLFPEEFNKDLGEVKLSLADKNKYIETLKEFFIKEYSDYSKSYAEYRMNELISQAEKRFKKYQEERDYIFSRIEQEFPENMAAQVQAENNWLAYNSPFLLLNERFSLSVNNMDLKNQIPYTKLSPKVTENGETTFVKWSKKDEVTGEIIKLRVADKYITNKPRRKSFDGNLTGFISDEFTQWEVEYFEKAIPEIEKGNTPPPTMLGYLQLIQELQKEYLDLLPRYLNKDIEYFTMLDVPKDWKELIDEATIFQKFTLYGQMVWDDVVKVASIPFVEKQLSNLDLITQQIEKEFNPKFQHDSFNQKGIGDLKTDDVFRYFDFIRNVTVNYKYKSEYESKFKIIQFLQSQGALTNKQKETYKQEEDLVNWIINNKLYNEERDSRKQVKNYGIVSNRKMFLTKFEKDKLKRLENQIKEIKEEYPNIEQAPEEVLEKLSNIQTQINKVQRQLTPSTAYDTFESYLRFSFLSWSPIGRIWDTFSSVYLNGFSEAVRNEHYNESDFAKSLAVTNLTYGADYLGFLGSTTALFGGIGALAFGNPLALTMFKTSAAVGVAGLTTDKLINNTALKQKVTQLLLRTGALDKADYLTKEDQRDILEGTLTLLKPYTLLEKADVYNKAGTLLPLFFSNKIKDKLGDNRPIWDAFLVNDNGYLIWNNKEFNTQESYNLNFTGKNSSDWVKFRKTVDRVVKNANGDSASNLSTNLGKKTTWKRMLLFLKTYMPQSFNRTWTKKTYDPLTNSFYTGKMAGLYLTLTKSAKGEEVSKEEKAAYNAAMFQLSLWMFLAITARIIHSAMSDVEDEDKSWLWTLFNITNRTQADVGNTFDVTSPKWERTTSFLPQIKFVFDVIKFIDATKKAVFGEGTIEQNDEMSRAEMSANKLIPKNIITDVDIRVEMDEKTGIEKEVMYYKMYDPSIDKELPYSKDISYNKLYEPVSRTKYKGLKLAPFNAYKQLDNLKKTNNIWK